MGLSWPSSGENFKFSCLPSEYRWTLIKFEIFGAGNWYLM